jgi:hypothetical protein
VSIRARVVIGHYLRQRRPAYHTDMLDSRAFLGFDRFGLELLQRTRLRLASPASACSASVFEKQIVLSTRHGVVLARLARCRLAGGDARAEVGSARMCSCTSSPALRDAGVSQAKIDAMLIDNPRRYFSGSAVEGAGQRPFNADAGFAEGKRTGGRAGQSTGLHRTVFNDRQHSPLSLPLAFLSGRPVRALKPVSRSSRAPAPRRTA